MENLSSTEASLLLAIKRRPNQRLSIYGNSLRGVVYIQVLHASNRLKQLNLIVENDSGLMQVNESALEKINTEIMREHLGGATVHTNDNPEILAKPLGTETVQKFEDVDVKVLEHLRASPKGRTAAELASPFGNKGTSLNWTLRNLIKKQLVVKRDTKYFIAEECDKVVHQTFEVEPVGTRRKVTTQLEIRTFILMQEGEFTLGACYDRMSKLYILDKEQFADVFTDLVLDGYFNVHDGNDYVQHDMEFCADNLHERCVNVTSEEDIAELLNDFLKTAKPVFKLEDAVKATSLRHDRITPKLAGFGYNVTDPDAISKRPTVVEHVGFTRFDDIDIVSAQSLIFGIVKIDVFMKRFNLDPSTKATVINNLQLLKMANYDSDSGFLGPISKVAEPEPIEEIEKYDEPEVQLEIPANEPEPVEEIEAREDEPCLTEEKEMPEENVRDDYKIPSHITALRSPLYGHRVLGVRMVDGARQLDVSTRPDAEWLAANPRSVEEEKPTQKEKPVQEENIHAHTNECTDHSHTFGPCGEVGHRGPTGPIREQVLFDTVNPVDPRWIVTLQMMEERFYHEHQTTTAKILSEIREHLSK